MSNTNEIASNDGARSPPPGYNAAVAAKTSNRSIVNKARFEDDVATEENPINLKPLKIYDDEVDPEGRSCMGDVSKDKVITDSSSLTNKANKKDAITPTNVAASPSGKGVAFLKIVACLCIMAVAVYAIKFFPSFNKAQRVVIQSRRSVGLVCEPDPSNYIVLKEIRQTNRIQKWRFDEEGYIVNRLNSLVATFDSNGSLYLDKKKDPESLEQKWDINEGVVTNRATKLVLHVQGNNIVVTQPLMDSNIEGFRRQRWQLTEEGYLENLNEFHFMLHVDTYTEVGNVVVWESAPERVKAPTNQVWTMRGDGIIESALFPGKVLSVNALHNVVLKPRKVGGEFLDQSWSLTEDHFLKSSLHPLLVMDVDDQSNVVIWDKKSGHNLNQKWAIITEEEDAKQRNVPIDTSYKQVHDEE